MIKDTLTPLVLKAELTELNLSQIARKYGVSKQHINHIYKEYRLRYPEMFAEREIKPDWLKAQLENHTVKEICDKTGTTYYRIRNLMKQYGLTKNTITTSFDKDYIREQYELICRSDQSLADEFGCSEGLIRKYRHKYSILKAHRPPLSERLPAETAKQLVQSEKLSVQEISKKYDATANEVMKLLKNYSIDV